MCKGKWTIGIRDALFLCSRLFLSAPIWYNVLVHRSFTMNCMRTGGEGVRPAERQRFLRVPGPSIVVAPFDLCGVVGPGQFSPDVLMKLLNVVEYRGMLLAFTSTGEAYLKPVGKPWARHEKFDFHTQNEEENVEEKEKDDE